VRFQYPVLGPEAFGEIICDRLSSYEFLVKDVATYLFSGRENETLMNEKDAIV
jgi:hypothetical protein